MRTRKRVAFVLASAAACGVGMMAFASSASAILPLCVPATPNTTAGNQSCVRGQIQPSNLPGSFANVSLYTQVATRYLHPGNRNAGGFAKEVTVYYDNDGRITPGTIPNCAVADVANKTIPQAYAACGPAGKNAYLSPPGTVSGKASTAPPSNFGACTLVFKGPTANQVVLYTRVFTVANSQPNCTTSNGGGQVTVTLVGTISNANVAGFGKKLVTPLPSGITLPLDNFYATVKRGNYVQARCPAGASPLKVRARFVYSVSTAPYQPDIANHSAACT
jgi:hypothetical protein